ncbi:hypothetical protein MNBD_GAMMA04-235 [hydrothermal vent metagenome]|uniref:N-acetyltransferase domain-containing protein n=1 Tax=hydrothermal vent metagenome TaxID=652676 RepID=A0A3B0VV28_9ZZZZ
MNILLRLMTPQDLPMVRAWRNHSKVNVFMCSQQFISAEAHQAWFEKMQQDALRYLYLYEEESVAMGFVQFQQKSLESAVYEWGFYLNPEAPKGTGFRLTSQALHQAFEVLKAHKVCGEVLGFNQASIQLHKRLGFKQEGLLEQQHFLNHQYHDVHCFGLLHHEFNPQVGEE